MTFSTLILAAGAGTRMKSDRSKVTHDLLDKPLVRWVVDAAWAAGSAQVITIVGHAREQVIPLVEDTTIVVQEERLGTGHAIMVARDALEGSAVLSSCAQSQEPRGEQAEQDRAVPQAPASLVVLCGDTPLITADTIASLAASQQESGAAVCVLTHLLDDPTNYGRIVRDEVGAVLCIVEEKDATPAQRAIQECNSGAYCFDLPVLLESLDKLTCNNAQGEYYLTDVIAICVEQGLPVAAHIVSAEETQGINSRMQLAQASKSMQRRINTAHMEAGVTMLDPTLVWIGAAVEIENDTELLPGTFLFGATSVGRGSVLGPNTRVTDSTIGRDCRVDESVVLESVLADGVNVGPRAYLRPGTVMKAGSKAGTHVEIKNSTIGEGSKVPHLSYLGDATLGADVNIGAGTITCNFDGAAKSPTTIGDRAFVGSDTMLVAPVVLGADTVIGAGSVISKDVPSGALAIERTEQKIIEGWAQKRLQEHMQE